jgi:hypothetical protein
MFTNSKFANIGERLRYEHQGSNGTRGFVGGEVVKGSSVALYIILRAASTVGASNSSSRSLGCSTRSLSPTNAPGFLEGSKGPD